MHLSGLTAFVGWVAALLEALVSRTNYLLARTPTIDNLVSALRACLGIFAVQLLPVVSNVPVDTTNKIRLPVDDIIDVLFRQALPFVLQSVSVRLFPSLLSSLSRLTHYS